MDGADLMDTFLKFINHLEINKAEEAELDGRSIATSSMSRTVGMSRRVRKDEKGGKLDIIHAMSGYDLQVFVNDGVVSVPQGV